VELFHHELEIQVRVSTELKSVRWKDGAVQASYLRWRPAIRCGRRLRDFPTGSANDGICRCLPRLWEIFCRGSVCSAHIGCQCSCLTLIYSRPYSEGPLELPYQRPSPRCRTFVSPLVEKVIQDLNERLVDKDLARLFENAFPNTLDTTVRWHVDGSQPKKEKTKAQSDIYYDRSVANWDGAQSFIVTGDINAEWLRDSTNQLAQYQVLAKKDKKLSNLILGAINTQAEFVLDQPFCNAFQPPAPSGLDPIGNGQTDNTSPYYEPSRVFECKYELDSLAAFLRISNQYWVNTHNPAFLTPRWLSALDTVLDVLDSQSSPTFDSYGHYDRNYYTFQRWTNVGTETLNLAGVGNPLANGTGLVRSAFRPSDDATIFGYLIPANAMMAVELGHAAQMLRDNGHAKKADILEGRAKTIKKGIWEHGVIDHPKWGRVFAYEVDGYGSRLLMDDANIPSLLSLPMLGFVDATDEVYMNTRKMILSQEGNPYYLTGIAFGGIGGPHIGLTHAWPMSVLVQAMTSDNDEEIEMCVDMVKNVSAMGLINESVNVQYHYDTTRKYLCRFIFRDIDVRQGVGLRGRTPYLPRRFYI
jgi:uncharacterized protein